MAPPTNDARLALLIDADNAGAKYLDALLVEIAKYGTASVRRAYGDWTTPQLSTWKDTLVEHSVQPIQQFSYTKGKNSTDSALIIDAMDLMHSGTVDGFCLLSSDSDFTRLAARIREQGLQAYGFGERKTPNSFVAACTTFIFVENLGPTKAATKTATMSDLTADPRWGRLIYDAVNTSADDDGWAHLAAVGTNLRKLAPDFDHRTWGYAKLKGLMEAHPAYVVESRETGAGKPPNAYVRRAK